MRVGRASEKGNRTRLRVAEGKKQEIAIQPGSSRERKQRIAKSLVEVGMEGTREPREGTQTEAKR